MTDLTLVNKVPMALNSSVNALKLVDTFRGQRMTDLLYAGLYRKIVHCEAFITINFKNLFLFILNLRIIQL